MSTEEASPRQAPPFAMQIEATEGCNLRCWFCGIRGIRERKGTDYRFMRPDTAVTIAQQVRELGWNPRIEFAMHGEPTLNSYLPMLVQAFRITLPKAWIMVTTNGVPLAEHERGFAYAVDRLYDAGVNMIALDDYAGLTVDDEHARPYALTRPGLHQYEYPAEAAGNPHWRRSHKLRILSVVEDIGVAVHGTHSHLGNHAGAAAPPDERAQGKPCAKPFRELSIRHDGNVAVCCNSWRGNDHIGNVHTDGLEAIWHSPVMYAYRRRLLRGKRDMPPCKGCTHTSERVGLLPDQKGKQRADYPVPQPGDEAVIMGAQREPMTTVVLRKWEQGAAT